MVDNRLHRLFQTRTTTQGDDIFGQYEVVAAHQTLNLTPIKRVAILTESFLPKVDGVSKTTYLTVRYLQETGREVLIFAPDSSVPNVGDSEVVGLPSVTMPAATETRIALPIPAIAKRIEAFQPDLIHLASPALMTVVGMAVGRELNIPVVANYQTDLPGYTAQYGFPLLENPLRSWLRYLHNGCHVNLVPSKSMGDTLRKQGFRRLRVWGRGVNLDRFNPQHFSQPMRDRLLNGRNPNSILCLYVGRLANEKSVHLLRKVADIEGIALTIVGDGQSREELETLFAGTGTYFTGYLYKDELATAFASADVFVFPGGHETFGQVVQEAMASGLATIVTNQGSVKDLVQEGKTGFIVDHSTEGFAKAARILQENRALLQEISENARSTAEKHPWSAVMAQLEDYYREAVAINQRFKQMYGYTYYHQPLSFGAISQRLQEITREFNKTIS
ncbi:MAG: glycosyltransferase family 1 protein [Anaerolineae bacterium]|nr:glycosyltransferase family 1 protein [Anaerolineae bacterium]